MIIQTLTNLDYFYQISLIRTYLLLIKIDRQRELFILFDIFQY